MFQEVSGSTPQLHFILYIALYAACGILIQLSLSLFYFVFCLALEIPGGLRLINYANT